jgi:hypothetical protein
MIGYVFGKSNKDIRPWESIDRDVYVNIDRAIEYMTTVINAESSSSIFKHTNIFDTPSHNSFKNMLNSIPVGGHTIYCDYSSTMYYVVVVEVKCI